MENRRYKVFVVGCNEPYIVKKHSGLNGRYIEDIINILDFLVDNIFVLFAGRFSNRQSEFQWVQTVLFF